MPKAKKPPAPPRLKKVKVSIKWATTEGVTSDSVASTNAIVAFSEARDLRPVTAEEATKRAILSGLRDLAALAVLEGFADEAEQAVRDARAAVEAVPA